MRRISAALVLAFSVLGLSSAKAHAQDSTQGPTVEAAVGTSVADKALVGTADSFPAGTASVSCFSRVTGAAGSDIEHVWYKGDTEVFRKKLSIAGSPFRTWTIKSLPADAAGAWRCDIVQGEKVLASVKFTVQ